MSSLGGDAVPIDQVERATFRELLFRLKLSRYEPNSQEIRTLKACENDALTRATVGGVVASAGFWFATRNTKLLSSVYARGTLGTVVAIVAGYYSAATATTDCLCSILRLDTPMGGEAAAILEKIEPGSELLKERQKALSHSAYGAEDMGRDGSGVLQAAKDAASKRVMSDEELQERIKELMSRGTGSGREVGRGVPAGRPGQKSSAGEGGTAEFSDGGGDAFDDWGIEPDSEHDVGPATSGQAQPYSQRKQLEELRRRRAEEARKARQGVSPSEDTRSRRRNQYGDVIQDDFQ